MDYFPKKHPGFVRWCIQCKFRQIYLIFLRPIFFLLRNISLIRWGYQSPPFILVQLPRRSLVERLTRFYLDFFRDHGLPILGIFDREIALQKKSYPKTGPTSFLAPTEEQWSTAEKNTRHYSLYLRPYRLLWSTWGFGMLLGGTFFITAQRIIEIGKACEAHKPEWKLNLIVSLLIVLWVSVIVPFFVYRVRRIPVLNKVWPAWPGKTGNMNKFLEGIPHYGLNSINEKVRNPVKKFFFRYIADYFPRIQERHLTAWRPSGSVQESFLRAAIVDHFVGLSDFPDRVMPRLVFRWCIDWLYSIWSGLIVVFFFAVYCSAAEIDTLRTIFPNFKISLSALAISWFIGTIFILRSEASVILRWCCLSHEDILFLPAAVRRLVTEQQPASIRLVSNTLLMSIYTAAGSVILVLFLTFAQNLP